MLYPACMGKTGQGNITGAVKWNQDDLKCWHPSVPFHMIEILIPSLFFIWQQLPELPYKEWPDPENSLNVITILLRDKDKKKDTSVCFSWRHTRTALH